MELSDASKTLPTSLVGSNAQPDRLIDRKKLASRFPPRVRATELWRIASEFLDQAQDDATLLAIRDQERAGVDIITDGEMRRESYSNRFATALEGVDIDNPGIALDRSGHPNPVPRVTGKVQRKHPVEVRDVEFLRKNTDRIIKMTVPGPFTMSQQAQNDFYTDEEEMALDYATAVNAEIKDLFAAGADVVQIDEPYMQARPEKARKYGLKALNAAIDGVKGTTAVHICFGYAAVIHVRPEGYSFLPEFANSPIQQISIETAQSNLDRAVLDKLPGKAMHKGTEHPGEHDAIIEQSLWDQVHGLISESPHKRSTRPKGRTPAILKGLIFGPTGAAMTPAHARKNGKLYRYYISTDVIRNGACACPIRRVPAAQIEAVVIAQIKTMVQTPEIIVATWRAARKSIKGLTEHQVGDELRRFDALWSELFPAEQARIVQLLVDRVDLSEKGADITLRTEGLASLIQDLHAVSGQRKDAA